MTTTNMTARPLGTIGRIQPWGQHSPEATLIRNTIPQWQHTFSGGEGADEPVRLPLHDTLRLATRDSALLRTERQLLQEITCALKSNP